MLMPKDALTIYRAAAELDMLVGGRIDKVSMPDRDTLILLIHTKSNGNHRLLLSCNPSLPRAHITVAAYDNPPAATGTLMYFRKRLVGAAITEIKRDKCERVVEIVLSALDELLNRVSYRLIVELTGKCANIVFVEENGIIGNALRKITSEAVGKRAVLIGMLYLPPNPTGRISVFENEFATAVINCGTSIGDAINRTVAGLGKPTVDEILYRLKIPADSATHPDLCREFVDFAQSLYEAPLSPAVGYDAQNKPQDYFITPYATFGGSIKQYPTLNDAMDAYYSGLAAAAALTAYSKPIRSAVKGAIEKNKKRLTEAQSKITDSATCEADRKIGELIISNIYRIKRGEREIDVQDYDSGEIVKIKLDPLKNAQQNAAAYFKTYNKKKRAKVFAEEAIGNANTALDILKSIEAELEFCTEKRELDEVREELVSHGFMRAQPQKGKKQKPPSPSQPLAFYIDGATVLVGKNHAQNDRITRSAARTDTWLHVKDVHGAHAVLKTSNPTQEQIVFAAKKAAYYSQARSAQKVAVDYTLIKHVYPHGGGKVDYKEYKTVIVAPEM